MTPNFSETIQREPATGRFLKGHSGNPAGRPRGSKNTSHRLDSSIRRMDGLSSQTKDRLFYLPLPPIRSERAAAVALERIQKAFTTGLITLPEAKAFDDRVLIRLHVLRSLRRTPVSGHRTLSPALSDALQRARQYSQQMEDQGPTEDFDEFDDDDASWPTRTPVREVATAEPSSDSAPRYPQVRAQEDMPQIHAHVDSAEIKGNVGYSLVKPDRIKCESEAQPLPMMSETPVEQSSELTGPPKQNAHAFIDGEQTGNAGPVDGWKQEESHPSATLLVDTSKPPGRFQATTTELTPPIAQTPPIYHHRDDYVARLMMPLGRLNGAKVRGNDW